MGLELALAGLELFAFMPENEGRSELADSFPELAVDFGCAGLAGQRILGLGNLGDDILEPGQIELGVVELVFGLAAFVEIGGPGCSSSSIKNRFSVGLEVTNVPIRTLLDDIVFVLGDGPLPQLFLDVLEPDGPAVQAGRRHLVRNTRWLIRISSSVFCKTRVTLGDAHGPDA